MEKEWILRDKYNGVPSQEFEYDLERLNKGEPVAYIIGWAPFLGVKIYLDSKPLIPRPETEYWVSKAIEDIQKSSIKEPRILDLCAGSGCIGVAILKAIPDARVDFSEIDLDHHDTILKNITENKIETSRTHIFSGDLFENIVEKYDFILSNPPYIDPGLQSRIEKSVREFEPALALLGGVDGMVIIEKILRNSPKYLRQGGKLYLEHEPEQALKIKTILSGQSFHDQFDLVRYSVFNNP